MIEKLAFFGQTGVFCTSGPLATCLKVSVEAEAKNLKDAFSLWLMPKHAAYFQSEVQGGKILLWIEVADADEEISACRSLLATSSGLRLDNEAAATGNRPRRAAPNRVTHGAVNAFHIPLVPKVEHAYRDLQS